MIVNITYIKNGQTIHAVKNETDDYRLEISQEGARTSVVCIPKTGITLVDAHITKCCEYEKNDKIYLNGYQSWTDSREFENGEKLRNIRRIQQEGWGGWGKQIGKRINDRFHFDNYGDSWFYRYKGGKLHGYTYTYIRRGGKAYLFGSLNENNAWLITEHRPRHSFLVLRSDCEGRYIDSPFTLFDYVEYEGQYLAVQKKYFSLFGRKDTPLLRGYTSWYNDYQDITEEKMLKALSSVDSGNYDVFQIDDGYETFVGDWLSTDEKKFPHGLSPIVEKIHENKLLAGIWLAPFVAETESGIYKEHPEWLLTEDGETVFAGSNWSSDAVLDLTREDVREYIRKCLEHFIELGFDFFKLDFLYAAAFCAKKAGLTRAEMMRQAMVFLREILGDRLILGCGVPLSSAQGLVDYCRTGTDVSLEFDDKLYMRMAHRERISTKYSIQNTIYRSPMDGWWFRNDPDVYLLRDDNIRLSKEQKKALLIINHLFGSVFFTSDDVGNYDEEKKSELEEAQKLTDAEVISWKKTLNVIGVRYRLDGTEHRFIYDVDKGELSYADQRQDRFDIRKSDRRTDDKEG